ncbi:hypothetical protein JM654_03875 [Microbacterium oxydans]|nr:hypothetical protein [Microbacterium oxydans]
MNPDELARQPRRARAEPHATRPHRLPAPRAGMVRDRTTNREVRGDWTNPDVLPIEGAFVAQTSTSLLGDATRQQAVEAKSLFCDGAFDVQKGDRIRDGADGAPIYTIGGIPPRARYEPLHRVDTATRDPTDPRGRLTERSGHGTQRQHRGRIQRGDSSRPCCDSRGWSASSIPSPRMRSRGCRQTHPGTPRHTSRALHIEHRESRYRRVTRVVGSDEKTLLIESKTGTMARGLEAGEAMRVMPPDLVTWLMGYVSDAAAADGHDVDVVGAEPEDLGLPMPRPLIVIRVDPGSRVDWTTFDRSVGATVLGGSKNAPDPDRRPRPLGRLRAVRRRASARYGQPHREGRLRRMQRALRGPRRTPDVARQYMTAQYVVEGSLVSHSPDTRIRRQST